jgi:hypothetical protein
MSRKENLLGLLAYRGNTNTHTATYSTHILSSNLKTLAMHKKLVLGRRKEPHHFDEAGFVT